MYGRYTILTSTMKQVISKIPGFFFIEPQTKLKYTIRFTYYLDDLWLLLYHSILIVVLQVFLIYESMLKILPEIVLCFKN